MIHSPEEKRANWLALHRKGGLENGSYFRRKKSKLVIVS